MSMVFANLVSVFPQHCNNYYNSRSQCKKIVHINMATKKPVKAVRWTTKSYGSIDNLAKEIAEIPEPSEGRVTILVRAIGLNFADVYECLGLYSPAGDPPLTPGFEVSGVVHAVADDVTDFKVGDRVFGISNFGAYCTAISLDYRYIRHLPETWTFEQGAAWPCQGLAAWYALFVLGGMGKDKCRLLTSPERRVLVHSAAGGVGLMVIELVRFIGGEVIATIGSPNKISVLRDRGIPAEHIIVRGVDDKEGFEKTVRSRLNGGGVDVVVDPLMGKYFQPGWKLLNPGGRHIVMGSSSLMPSTALGIRHLWSLLVLGWCFLTRPRIDPVAAMNENKTMSAFNLSLLFDRADLIQTGFSELSEAISSPPFISKTYPFEDVKEALHALQSGRSVGKVVLTVSEEN